MAFIGYVIFAQFVGDEFAPFSNLKQASSAYSF